MRAPIDWLKEYVDFRLSLKELSWKLTEMGLNVDKIEKSPLGEILELEITPNRPDLLSIVGIAREISAITGNKLTIKEPGIIIKKSVKSLDIKIIPDFKIVPRITSVIIKNVTVSSSPDWLKRRIIQIGLRPINNLVDITNYVLWMHGSLLHVFDYDKIIGHEMTVGLTEGGETFRSLDCLDYSLPKNAIIIKDAERIIDLLPLKGGENTAASAGTKNILLHSVIVDPILTRRTSQAIKLQSDSSQRAEHGLDPNGTIKALNQALTLILELAGGEIASDIIDYKEKDIVPWNISFNLERLEKVLGISIPHNSVLNILNKLNLNPVLQKNEIACTIPTYRQDLKIGEDLIEEVARMYGYNRFPKTLPHTPPTVKSVAYRVFYESDRLAKNTLAGAGFSETYTFSLISGEMLDLFSINHSNAVNIENPVSLEYRFLRPSILPNLLTAVKLNQPNFDRIELFELGKIYRTGRNYKEISVLSVVSDYPSFYHLKGILQLILRKSGIYDPEFEPLANNSGNLLNMAFLTPESAAVTISGQEIGIIGAVKPQIQHNLSIRKIIYAAELNFDLIKQNSKLKKFIPVSLNPPLIEDLTFSVPVKVAAARIIETIKSTNKLINEVKAVDRYGDKITFRIIYQSDKGNLADRDVKNIRSKIVSNLLSGFNCILQGKL